jgi:hypothetical protein
LEGLNGLSILDDALEEAGLHPTFRWNLRSM